MDCKTISSFSSAEKNLTSVDNKFDKTDANHRKLIRHLYRRIGYGASLADIEYAHGKTIGNLVNYLIDDVELDENNNPVPDPNNPGEYKRIGAANITLPVDSEGKQMFDWQHRPMQIKDVNNDNVVSQTVNTSIIVNYWINEAITESVRSKLMLFWHNHFVIQEPIYLLSYAVLRYYNVLFNNAFGNFKDFVEEIGRTPMMLVYLNGTENLGKPDGDYTQGGGPNENYARELLELFTMGEYYKGSKNYTSKDINELARALTGWTKGNHGDFFNDIPSVNEFRFMYTLHDWGTDDTQTNKTLFEQNYSGKEFWDDVLNGAPTVPTNGGNEVAIGNPDATSPTLDDKYVAAGTKEYDKVHQIIFDKKAVQISYFICKKLYEYYVYGDTENPKFQELQDANGESVESFIDQLAATFRNNSWDIMPVLKRLFKSKHFYDAGVMSAQIKSPVECAVSFFHTADLKPSQDNNGNTYDDYDYTYQFTLMPSTDEGKDSPIDAYNPPHPSYKPDYNNGKIRAMTGENAAPADVQGGYSIFTQQDTWRIKGRCVTMGQDILNPPNVAGWQGHRDWLNGYTLTRRWEMLNHFIDKFSPTTKEKFRLLAVQLMADDPIQITNPVDGELMVRSVWRHFFCIEPTDRQVADAIAVYKGDWDYPGVPNIKGYPTSSDPTIPTTSEVAEQFMKMLEYMIRQPEYQLT